MNSNFISFKNLVDSYELNQINYTYLNRNALSLLKTDIPNTKYRVGERFILNIINLFEKDKIVTTDNFDFTGYADSFFNICREKNYKISVYGGSDSELNFFVNNLRQSYDLSFVDLYHGYMSSDFYVKRIADFSADIVILGLGNPKQNIVLANSAYEGKTGIHTCGAFISQYSIRFNRSNNLPRWLYRSITEKNHFFRTIKLTLTSVFKIFYFYIFIKK